MLKGKKVILRAIERDDLKYFVKWLNNQEIIKNMAIFYPFSLAQEEEWFEKTLRDDKQKHFLITTNKNKPIGGIGIQGIDWKNRKAHLGLFIGEKNYWNKGYGTNAILTLLKFAFNEMNLNKISLTAFEHHKRAIKCYEKCGFEKGGVLEEEIYKDGKYQNLIAMAILSSKFKNLRM